MFIMQQKQYLFVENKRYLNAFCNCRPCQSLNVCQNKIKPIKKKRLSIHRCDDLKNKELGGMYYSNQTR